MHVLRVYLEVFFSEGKGRVQSSLVQSPAAQRRIKKSAWVRAASAVNDYKVCGRKQDAQMLILTD
jgi:hypothetical protein